MEPSLNQFYSEPKEDSEPNSLEALVDSTDKDPSLFATLRNIVENEEIVREISP